MRLNLALLASLAFATGCSSAGSPVQTLGGISPSMSPSASGTASFSILVPGAATASTARRHGLYVSPNTQSVTITLQSSGGVAAAGPTVTFATTAGAPNCTASGSGLTCTATLTVPAGVDVFSVTAFAQPGGGGSALSGGTASATIVVGGSSPVTLTLGGTVSSISLSLSGNLVAGVAATLPLAVTAKDASGATIVGFDPYATPITLALADPCGAQLSATAVPSPSTAISLAYNGRAFNSITVTASAPGVSASSGSTLSIAVRGPNVRYTSVVIFGDSLSDTGNVANLTQQNYGIRYPGTSFNYADGRFTDGPTTTPAARCYTGTWIEQLAATFIGKPVIKNSLDGGADYAYAGATTANGTTTAGASATVTVSSENLGQQVSDYIAGHPAITNTTLFVVWAGTDELLSNANNTSNSANAAAAREVAVIQRLINAGATDFLVPNVPPLGALPSLNGSGNAGAQTQAAASFDQALASGLANLPASNAMNTLRIVPLDVFALFNATITSPGGAGFANVTSSAQGNAGVNPDTYLFWDANEPTTAGHNLIAASAATAIASP